MLVLFLVLFDSINFYLAKKKSLLNIISNVEYLILLEKYQHTQQLAVIFNTDHNSSQINETNCEGLV